MSKVVYLHVGGPKSGTTFVQKVLEHNTGALAAAGVLVAGPRLDLIHAAMVVREDPRLADLPDSARQAWQRVVSQVREHPGHSAVISYELFAGASAEQARRALADLAGVEVHVVVSARDLGKSVPSSWQEQLKFGLTTPLERWVVPGEDAVRSEWGWRTLQPANVARRWGADLPADRVHVVTVPAAGGDAAQLWRRFAAACGLADLELDLAVERVNESLGVVEAELLRRVNVALDGRIRGGRAKSLWQRDLLAHRVLAPLGREAIGLPDKHRALAAEQAEAAIADIEQAGWGVHGDLADLRPSSSPGRLPGEVGDQEVAESAALALADLLVWARGAGADPHAEVSDPTSAPDTGSGVRAAVRGTLTRLSRGTRDRRVVHLERRIAELEAQVEQQRALQLRVATLSDLVAQLLLPAAQQDERVTGEALRAYRRRSL